jgi:hypothetical protein
MKTEQEQLAECRANWEATKPDAVFADYWLGWKAARETLQSKTFSASEITISIRMPDGTTQEIQPVELKSWRDSKNH